MEEPMRNLTITLQPDWKAAIRQAGKRAHASTYQGETLNFETPGVFFGKLTERRWGIIHALQVDGGEVGVRELARRLNRDPSRVHADAGVLLELGLIERTPRGSLRCPYDDIHVDMHMSTTRAA
jgi:predicted transcriptional regulator